ncbi:MAG: N-acetyltransferase, partial [Thermomicrobiales bacterium]|nr:N-acetyltransferase [Thermomicrobiales bacterium]
PALPALLLSSDEGRPVYARMGFLPLLRWTYWSRRR